MHVISAQLFHFCRSFVTVENRAGGMVATHMQFALRVADFTESAQILFDDAAAERFLGE